MDHPADGRQQGRRRGACRSSSRPSWSASASSRATRWDLYPADTLNRIDGHNSIAWRTDAWELVEANTIAIPYFHGAKVQMPYILLRHMASNRLVWFANFHNPANTRYVGDSTMWRAQARILEVGLANKIWESGVPLIYTGDMNETRRTSVP